MVDASVGDSASKQKPRAEKPRLHTRRPDLQGMRAVAVLAVFADHLVGWPSGGFVGVDVFFVLSGFFITGLLIRERTKTGKVSFKNFYIRRVKRILPSALLVLVVTVIGSYLLFPAVRAKETLLDALYAALFVSNFRFESLGADYFQQDQPPSPLQHFWSLSIEEQFYFVWPVLLLLLFAITRGHKRRGRGWARQWALFASMGAIVAISFSWSLWLSASNPNVAYFSTFTRVWELGTGALLAIAAPWLSRIPNSIRPAIAYLGIAGVIGSLFVINPTVQFPAPWAALPVLATALTIAAFQGAEVRGMQPLTNRVVRYLGDTSYTLYLWHWPVIILLFSVIPKGPVFNCVAIVLALILTVTTYHFYEDPIRKSGWLLESHQRQRESRLLPQLSLPVWSVIGGLTAVAMVITITGIGYSEKIRVAQELAAAESETTPEFAPLSPEPNPCFGAPAMLNEDCVLWNPDKLLEPGVDEFARDNKSREDGCFTVEYEDLASCTFGYKEDDAVDIALVGDSHAAALLPALWPVLNANKWRLTTFIGEGCKFRIPYDPRCEKSEAVIKTRLMTEPFDLVLTSGRINERPATQYQEAWAPIAEAGRRIVALVDNPIASEESVACLTRLRLGGDETLGECGTPRAEAIPYADPQIEAAQLVPGTQLIDLTDFYCTADWCPSIIGNVIAYRDGGNTHLTATFARTLAPAIEDGLKRALAVQPVSASP